MALVADAIEVCVMMVMYTQQKYKRNMSLLPFSWTEVKYVMFPICKQKAYFS